jgi:hypothetical protein
MKMIFLAFTASFIFMIGYSQSISKITITNNGTIDVISIGLDENVQVYLTKDGNISNWGFDKFIGYQENYDGVLEPYMGRVEYYTQDDDEALRGKIKYIGRTLITYYPSYEREELKGKIKSIGSFIVNYYFSYDDRAFAGNIKTIGQQIITWYASYENEAVKGKLKAVGPTSITYYGSFEDKAYSGKIKSIGRFTITYYSSFEQYSGSVKTGTQLLNANGIKYFIRNY